MQHMKQKNGYLEQCLMLYRWKIDNDWNKLQTFCQTCTSASLYAHSL